LTENVRQALERVAGCQKIVYHEHMILRPQVFPGDRNLIFGFFGEGEDATCKDCAGHVGGFVFLRKYDRHPESQPGGQGRGDAGGFNGEDSCHRHGLVTEVKFRTNVTLEHRIDLVIQKGVHLHDASREDFAILPDAILQSLHVAKPHLNRGRC
jgi:hypothetical protein